jgi:hypothetical protein
VHLVGGGRAKAAQVYPKELCEAMICGLKRQLEKDGKGLSHQQHGGDGWRPSSR